MYKKIFTAAVLVFLIMSKTAWADYLELSVTKDSWDNSLLGVSFKGASDKSFIIKFRKVGTSNWDVEEVDEDHPDITVAGSYFSTNLGPLECGTEYQVKVKRKGRGYRSVNETTRGCGVNPCPHGGYFDQEHCQIGQAPAGTDAFISEGYYYYTPINTNSCPYPGSWFDGAHCQVQQVPSGATPFIHLNHWYYIAYP